MVKSKSYFSFIILLLILFSTPVFAASTCTTIASCVKEINSELITQAAVSEAPKITEVPTPQVTISTPLETKIHEAINQERKLQGLSALQLLRELTAAAQLHSKDMAQNNYFSHISLDGGTFSQRIFQQGASCHSLAENIAMSSARSEADTITTTVQGWMNSPGHRENILGNYLAEGIGVAIATNGDVYVTQDFCS